MGLQLFKGDGTSTVNGFIGVDTADSYLQLGGGDFGIADTTPDARIEISLDGEKADDKSDSKEALLAAHGYDLIVLSERVVIETPALALKRIAEKLEIVGDFDEDDFIL